MQRPGDHTVILGCDGEQDINNADDAQVDPQAAQFLHAYMKHYPDFKRDETEQPMVWTGIRGYTDAYLPICDAVPGKLGQYIVGLAEVSACADVVQSAGFSGHGQPRIPLCSKNMASFILGGLDAPYTLPEPLRWTEERTADKEWWKKMEFRFR
jgi:glycine/D-amino acid oxidase-like deaminating enzyme